MFYARMNMYNSDLPFLFLVAFSFLLNLYLNGNVQFYK